MEDLEKNKDVAVRGDQLPAQSEPADEEHETSENRQQKENRAQQNTKVPAKRGRKMKNTNVVKAVDGINNVVHE